MPDRYWVGGTASWNGVAGTKWAATSGGPGGESIPTTADDVFFDANSNTGGSIIVTIAVGNTGAKSINCTGFTRTITGVSSITVAGSVTLVAAMTWSHSATMTFTGTGTLTTAGKTFSGVTVNDAGTTLTLGDALNISTRTITVTQGTFTTAGFAVTAGSLSSSNTNTRTINLGASTLNLSGTSPVVFTTPTNLTFNAGTSQINISGIPSTLAGGGQTFNNVTFTTTIGIGGTITGTNTFNNLTFTPSSSSNRTGFAFSNNQIITGTLLCAGATSRRRISLEASVVGTACTLTVATLSANDCDFRDITLAGAAAGASPTRAGDCGGNSGVNFPAAKTVYRVGAGGSIGDANAWATSSGGAGADANFPLAQDTMVFDNNTGSSSIDFGVPYNFGSLDASNRTSALTFNYNNSGNYYGAYTLGSGLTITNTLSQTFVGRGTMNITSAGKVITFPITVNAPGGTFRLLDATTLSGSFTLTQGTLDLNNLTLTSTTFASSNSNTRTLAFGTGNITVTSTGTVWNTNTFTNMTVTGTPVVNVTNATATATTVSPGPATEANSISFNFTAGTYSLTLTGGNVRNLNFTGFAGVLDTQGRTIFGDLTLSAGMTLTAGALTTTFASTSPTPRTITTNGKTFDFPLAFNGVGGTFRLLDALTLTSSRGVTLTNGTLDLNNLTLSCGSFNSSNSNTRTLAFGTGNITITSSGTSVWTTANTTDMTVTGAPVVNVTHNTATATSVSPGSLNEDNSISFNFTAGTYSLTLSGGNVLNLNFTGFAGTLNSASRTIFGNLILSSGMTLTAGTNAQTFASTSGTPRTITTNGKTLDFPLTFDGVGGTFRLLDALTMGSTRTLTHTNGTIDLNGFNLTVGTAYTTAAGTKNLTFNAGTLTCPAAGNAFNNSQPTNFTTTAGTGTGTINMISATSKNFFGGYRTYNCTLNNGGAGALNIYGSNTFTTLANSVQPTSFLFEDSETTTLTNWNISGTPGNLVTINSMSGGNMHGLSKASGTVNADYLSITNSFATGGATWNAGDNSTNGGNNSGWTFAQILGAGNFFMMLRL